MFWYLPLLAFGMDLSTEFVETNDVSVRQTRSGEEARTTNFLIHSPHNGPSSRRLAVQCEAYRASLVKEWLSEADERWWSQPCIVAIHSIRDRYLVAVGPKGANTSGSSTLETESGRILHRRIDLLLNEAGDVTALHHELTHVVLADRFEPGLLPLWASEGIATLSDTTRKQQLHLRDCRLAVTRGNDLHLRTLLSLRQFEGQHEVAPFYGQSLSLTQFLLAKSDTRQLAMFFDRAKTTGYHEALRECYGIEGIDELDRLWHKYHEDCEVTHESRRR